MKNTLLTAILPVFISLLFLGCSKDDDNETDAPKGNQPKGVEAVDLGLPSGTKWANMNVGATKPEEYGGYYAWGETEEKGEYTEENYAYYRDGAYLDLGSDIAGTEYDVAHVKWGGKWQMPSVNQFKELLNNSERYKTTLNGVNGYKFIGSNGNSIFLPSSNDWHGGTRGGYDNAASYWSGRVTVAHSERSYTLYFDDYFDIRISDGYKCEGRVVRPVCK